MGGGRAVLVQIIRKNLTEGREQNMFKICDSTIN